MHMCPTTVSVVPASVVPMPTSDANECDADEQETDALPEAIAQRR